MTTPSSGHPPGAPDGSGSPVGRRVQVISFAASAHFDDNATVPSGTTGTVTAVTSDGAMHVHWDNGVRLGLSTRDAFVWAPEEQWSEQAFAERLVQARSEISKSNVDSTLTLLTVTARQAGLDEVSAEIEALRFDEYRHVTERLRRISVGLRRRLDLPD